MSDPTLPADPQHLDAASVRATVERLDARIKARFPTRNLTRLPGQLVEVIEAKVCSARRFSLVWSSSRIDSADDAIMARLTCTQSS